MAVGATTIMILEALVQYGYSLDWSKCQDFPNDHQAQIPCDIAIGTASRGICSEKTFSVC